MNVEKEWKFIQEQIHREKPKKENCTKREVLFCMQMLLKSTDKKDLTVYERTKEFYQAGRGGK